jgi:hypothetical protein
VRYADYPVHLDGVVRGRYPGIGGPALRRAAADRQFGARRPAQKNPYAKLFEARDALKQAPQQVAQDAPKKTLVCGMTMIEADPHFDAKMRVTPPKDANVRYAIRAVDPPVCNPARK